MRMKPHKGRIELWVRKPCNGGFCYLGLFEGHPQFNGTIRHTSLVVRQDGKEIETLHSRYVLGIPLINRSESWKQET